MAHLSPYLRKWFRQNIPVHLLTMIPILLLIQLTSCCVFTYKERSKQITEQCKMEAVRNYLNTVVKISSYRREMFHVKARNCTANLRPLIADSPSSFQFEVCKPDEDSPTATLCLSKHIDNEWMLHASCKVD